MKHRLPKIYLLFLLVSGLSTDSLLAQVVSTADSVRATFNFKQAPWYVRSVPFSIYTGAGKTSDRVAQNIEIGKTFRVIDLGVAFGRSTLRPDTTLFAEARVTMNVANYGIFANEMALGAGKLFDTKGSLMLELAYNIFAQISPKVGIGFTTGYYDFSNDTFDSSKTFYGFILRYGVPRTDSGGIVGLGRGGRRIRAKHPHR